MIYANIFLRKIEKTSVWLRNPLYRHDLRVCVDVLDLVTERSEKALKSVLRDDDRSAAIVRMERERGGVFEAAVKEENDMTFGIVDESERADTTGFQAEIAHHPFG